MTHNAGSDAGRFGVPKSFHEKPVTRIYKAEDMARAWDEGYSQCASDCGHYQYQTRPTNPYRVLPPVGQEPHYGFDPSTGRRVLLSTPDGKPIVTRVTPPGVES